MNKLNGVPLKEADTIHEKYILGFLDQETKQLRYGKLEFTCNVHNGKITNVQCVREIKSLCINNLKGEEV